MVMLSGTQDASVIVINGQTHTISSDAGCRMIRVCVLWQVRLLPHLAPRSYESAFMDSAQSTHECGASRSARSMHKQNPSIPTAS